MQQCAVRSCDYVVEAFIEDFPVCALHDARQTRVWLEKLYLPCAGTSEGKPIVFPSHIKLTQEHFEPKESIKGVKAFDDPYLHELSNDLENQTGIVHPDQDLTVK